MSVQVRNLDHLRLFRMDLKLFMERVKNALDSARNDAARTKWWLQYDRLPYWQGQVRRREAKLNQARGDLLGAKLTDATETQFAERQEVIRAELALEEAQRKLAEVQRRLAHFDHEAAEALQLCRKLYHDVDQLLPRAVHTLDGMVEALEAYLEERPPEEVTGDPEAPLEEEP